MTADGPETPADASGLRALLAPRSVAVVGASSDPARIGGRPVAYTLRAGFAGALYPVNPARETVQGLRAYPDLASIPGEVEFALLAVPAKALEGALDACAAKGVRAAVVFSAGFAEMGAEGAALQARLVAKARAAGLRLLGPNCLGLYNAAVGHCPTFTSFLQDGPPPPGRVGLITQSGAFGTHLLNMARARRIGVSLWASTGNEADVTLAELLEHVVETGGLDALGLYMEAVNDRARFLHALERARERGVPVAVMKVGTSEVGAEAARSHTASLAGSDAGLEAALARHGAARARTTEELLDILYAASVAPLPKGRRIAIVTVSGGAGVLMADAAAEHGLEVPALPLAAQARLREANPLMGVRNPVDTTAHALNDPSLIGRALEVVASSGAADMTAAFFTSWTAQPAMASAIREAVRAARRPGAPFALVCQGDDATLAAYEAEGCPVFEDPSRAVRALAHLARISEAMRREEPPDPPPVLDVRLDVRLGARAMGEAEAKAALARAGIEVPPEAVARTPAEAAQAAGRVGFPVALKVVSPDLPHKSDVGGVALNLADAAAVEAEAEAMLARVAEAAPSARVEGLLVSRMAGEGVEVIVGARVDPVMGPLVVVGLGGVFVEVLRDVATELAPIGPRRARAMLGSLRGAALLAGARGRPPLDLDAAADAVARLSVLAADNEDMLGSIEVNPLLVRERGAVALDALILPLEDAG